MNRYLPLSFAFVAFAALALSAVAADSPQFRGPNRDGIYKDTKLLATWPEGGPALAWKADGIGKGYASASVVGGTIYVPGMEDDKQGYLYALEAATGKLKWKTAYGPETEDSQAPGARSTPTVDGDKIYLISGLGVLVCFNAADGKVVWQNAFYKEFKGKETMWAIAESPLVDGDLVYATPGGEDASIVALDKKTGKTVWTSKGLSEAHAYCSPTILTFGSTRELVTMTGKSVVSLDPKSGKVLWTHEHKTNYDIHAVTPAAEKNVLYYTAGYGSGGGALDVSADGTKVTQKWLDKNLDCQHHGIVLLNGYIYGTSQTKSQLWCLELATGKVMWSSDMVTQGGLAYADGMLYVYQGAKKGVVALVKADPTKFELAGEIKIPQGKDKHWAHPVIANGKLFIRYADTLYAYDIAAK